MVMRFAGKLKPLLIMALRTRSRASFTVVSGKPTSVSAGRPLLICASMTTSGASTPIAARVRTLDNVITAP